VNATVAVGGLVRDTAHVAFNLTCTAVPRTGADLLLTTTGTNPDNQYRVTIYATSCGYYYSYCNGWVGNVPGNGTVPVALPAGSYTYSVADVAPGCSGTLGGTFIVANQQVTSVALTFACAPTGTLVAGVQASGVDIGTYYAVAIDASSWHGVAPGGSVSVPLSAGLHSVALSGVGSNCTVTSANPLSVMITSGATTNVNFSVTCVANPVLRVTVTTTGTGIPANFVVGVDYDYYYGYVYSTAIPSNGTASFSLPSGNHLVSLNQVPLNCSVTSPNNLSVDVPPGSTTNVAFTVVCN
jgi:hypothetical protein